MTKMIHESEYYAIVGKCFEVHNYLGKGFLEVVYKDALEFEFKNAGIPYQREVKYQVNYKNIILPHFFCADFVVYDKIILEIKSVSFMRDEFTAQAINYLNISKNKLAIIVNFGESKVNTKRIIL